MDPGTRLRIADSEVRATILAVVRQLAQRGACVCTVAFHSIVYVYVQALVCTLSQTHHPTPTHQGATRFCTVKHCNRRLTSCAVVWDDAKAPETINLNHVSYRIVPDNAKEASTDDDDAADNHAASLSYQSTDEEDNTTKDNTAAAVGRLDVLQGSAAEDASALVHDAQHPELFVDINHQLAQRARSVLQALYAYAREAGEGVLAPTALGELHAGEAFDPEQVQWGVGGVCEMCVNNSTCSKKVASW